MITDVNELYNADGLSNRLTQTSLTDSFPDTKNRRMLNITEHKILWAIHNSNKNLQTVHNKLQDFMNV